MGLFGGPPVADAQTDQTLRRQIAERVTAVMAPGLFVVFLAGILAVLALPPIEWNRVVVASAVVWASGLAWWLGRTGRVLWAAHAFVLALTGAALLAMSVAGGVHAPGYWSALVIVALVSWFYGARPAVAFAVMWLAVGGVFVWLETQGGLPGYRPATPAILWVSGAILLVSALIVSTIPGRMLHHSLAVSEAARLEAEAAREAQAQASRALAAQDAALRESEAFRRRVFESSRMPIVVADGETLRYLDCNPAAIAIYRFASREETLGKTPMDVSAPLQYDGSPSADKALAYRAKALSEGMVVFEWRHQRPDGEIWDAEVHLVRFEAAGRQLLQFTLQDITARKQAEALARDAETRLAAAIEAGGLACYEWAIDTDTAVLDDAAQAMVGIPPAEAHRARAYWTGRIHPEDLAEVQSLTRRLIDGELGHGWVEYRYHHPDRGWRWISHAARLFTGEQYGGGRCLVGVLQDITESRQAAARTREQAALLDITQDAVCVLRSDGTIGYWNRAATAIYGWTAEEAVGRPAEQVVGAGCEEDLRAALGQVAEGATWSGELRALTKARRPIVTLTRGSAVRDEDGRPAGCLLVSTDMTEQHQLEKRYLRAQRLESLGALASGIAHDLNNVLAPIVMALDLLGDSLRSSEDQATLELLQTSAQRGAGIVKQLLTFARGSETRHTEVNTRYLLAEVGKLVEQTFPRDIRFQLSYPPDVWNLIGDATQVHQVLLNLCVNARDALGHGGRLSIAAENVEIDAIYAQLNPDACPGRYIRLLVADTGGGIPPEALDRIFDPFFTTKAPGQGTGLGLATVQTIVRNHRGFVEVESVVGRGTAFRVHVPAAPGGTAAAVRAAEPAAARGQGELLLVLDDDTAVRRIAQNVLEGARYRVMTAADGAEGLAMFRGRAAEISLAIVDMMMPELGGAEVIKAIRSIDPRMPVIAMSGLPSRRDDAFLAAGGTVDFLQKPFTGTELLRAAAAALGRRPKD